MIDRMTRCSVAILLLVACGAMSSCGGVVQIASQPLPDLFVNVQPSGGTFYHEFDNAASYAPLRESVWSAFVASPGQAFVPGFVGQIGIADQGTDPSDWQVSYVGWESAFNYTLTSKAGFTGASIGFALAWNRYEAYDEFVPFQLEVRDAQGDLIFEMPVSESSPFHEPLEYGLTAAQFANLPTGNDVVLRASTDSFKRRNVLPFSAPGDLLINLASCGIAITHVRLHRAGGGTPPPDGTLDDQGGSENDGPIQPDEDDGNEEADSAAHIFRTRCAVCHGEPERLAGSGWMIVPDMGEVSPAMDGIELSDREVELLRRLIEGAPSQQPGDDDNSGSNEPTPEDEDGDSDGDDGDGSWEDEDSNDDDTSSDDDEGIWEDPFSVDCGQRSVASLPGPGYIEMIASFDLEAQPVDSALLRVFGVAAAGCEMALPGRVLYEIDDQGKIIAYVTLFEYEGEKIYTKTPTQDDSRFVIEDNCLELTGEGQSESPGPIDVPITSPGICGAGAQTAFAVDRDGPVFGTPTGDYVCVQGDVDYACRDCWEEGGSWFSVDALAGSYTSLGSLDGVSVSAWAMVCNEPDVPVDIHAGDSAVYEMATTIEYRQSPSPEELGYEAFEIPVFP